MQGWFKSALCTGPLRLQDLLRVFTAAQSQILEASRFGPISGLHVQAQKVLDLVVVESRIWFAFPSRETFKTIGGLLTDF